MYYQQEQLKVWLYCRLSRDDDPIKDSLENQKAIATDYCINNEYEIVGSSFDDNIGGFEFEKRDGLLEVLNVAKQGKMNAVVVKDMSRLGRHKLYTPLFREQLRELGVRVISATENVDTFDENDDLVISIKDILNDAYVRDISRKIRFGYEQKQKKGIVIIPPFGYTKNANGEVIIVEECAEIVRLIYKLYLEGYGYRKLTLYLNEHKIKTPSYYQSVHIGKKIPYNATQMGKDFIWHDRTVVNILSNEAYIGVLANRKGTKSKIYKTRTYIKPADWIRHENFYPTIISRDTFNLVQTVRESRMKITASNNTKIYRYAGLLRCRECGSAFASKARKQYGFIEYICNAYSRLGTKYCNSHRIRESVLDDIVYEQIAHFRSLASKHWNKIDSIINQWTKEEQAGKNSLHAMETEIAKLRSELKDILKKQIQSPDRAELLEEIAADLEERLKQLRGQANSQKESEFIKSSASTVYRNAIQIFNDAIQNRNIDDAHLRAIISKIVIGQNADGSLDVDITLRSPLLSSIQEIETIHDVMSVAEESQRCDAVQDKYLEK